MVFTCFHSTKLTIFFILAVTGLIKYTLLSSYYYISSAVYTYSPYYAPCYTLKSFNVHSHSSVAMINKRFYTTDVKDSTLPPNWVTGFVDAEGSFSLKISKSSSTRSGYNIVPEFKIELHLREILLLRKIHTFFGIGIIYEFEDRNKAYYSVQSARDLTNIIIPHFDKYPLITQKRADYLLFKEAVNLLLTGKARSSIEGVNEIISIKGSMNRGLSDKLKINFPNVQYVSRPVFDVQDIKDLNWLAGFVDGEGYFYVKSLKDNLYSIGYKVTLVFSVTQHARDEILLTKFIDLLGCGKIEKASTRPDAVNYRVNKFSDIQAKIIPFFLKYPLQSVKYRDFLDFIKVVDIVAVKGHLTPEGIKKINYLKSGMNRGRVDY